MKTIDVTKPQLSAVSISANAPVVGFAGVGKIITLTFTSNEILSSTAVVLATHGVAATNTNGNSYSTQITVASNEKEGIAAFSIDFVDRAGNPGVTVTSTLDGTSVVIGLQHIFFFSFLFLLLFIFFYLFIYLL